MFISEKTRLTSLKEFILYIGIMLFIALFGFIYEQCSHGVNSNYMWFAWVWVLFGLIPYAIFFLTPIKKVPGVLTACVYNLGVALITTRSIFLGVLEIYGKTNERMVLIYTITSILFLSAGLFLYLLGLFLPKKDTNE